MSCDLLSLATPGVAKLQPYHPGKPTEELERELGIKNIVKLASNENPVGASPKVIQKLASFNDYARYPDGNGFRLKQVLREFYSVQENQITLGNGSNDILELVARAFANPGDEIVFSEHAFAVYPLATLAVGATPVIVKAKDWGHDLDAMLAAITEKTSVIFIANPNNPTGTWLDNEALKNFIAAVPEHVIVVLDEAYYEYRAMAEDTVDALQWLEDSPNLLISRTFSKAYGLAALRVGYSFSHPDVANILNRVRQPFNVNTPALLAAEVAIQDQEHIKASVIVNQSGMDYFTKVFDSMGLHYIPSRGNFISVDLQQDGLALYDALLQEGVIVRPVANYGMPEHLRISIGTEEENHRFVKALTKVLA